MIELTREEWQALVNDHSAALELLREIASGPHTCYSNCIICRVKTFLFTEPGKR